MKATAAHMLRVFLAGLLAALPLAATVAVFWWGVTTLLGWFGPGSTIGTALVRVVGLGVPASEIVGYLIGVGIIVVAIFALGLLVEAGLQRGLVALLEAVLGRIPVVRTVYDFAQKMVALVSQRDDDGVRSMRAVWCHFGGVGGAAVLALLSTPEPVTIGDKAYIAVLVPTAPVPVGGGLLYVPADWVTPADVGIEALTSIYVSMGVTSAQYLGAAKIVGPQDAPASASGASKGA